MSFLTDDDRNARSTVQKAVDKEVQRLKIEAVKEMRILAEELKSTIRKKVREGNKVSFIIISTPEERWIQMSEEEPLDGPYIWRDVCDKLAESGVQLFKSVFDKYLQLEYGKEYSVIEADETLRRMSRNIDSWCGDDEGRSGVGVYARIVFDPPL